MKIMYPDCEIEVRTMIIKKKEKITKRFLLKER